jgi:hypothetical protein
MTFAPRFTSDTSIAPHARGPWMGVAIRTRRTAKFHFKRFDGTG